MRLLFLHHPADYSFGRSLQGVTELLVELGHEVHVLLLGKAGHVSGLLHPAVTVHERALSATLYSRSLAPRLHAVRRTLGLKPPCPLSSPLLRLGAAAAYLLGFLSLGTKFDAVVSPEHRAGALWIRRLRHQPVVTLAHGPLALVAPLWGFSRHRLDLRMSSWIEAKALGESNSAVLPSELLRRTLLEARWQLPRHVFVVPHILSRGAVSARASVKESEPIVLAVGSVGHAKGSDVLIKAVASLRNLRPFVRFVGAEEPGPSWSSKIDDAKRVADELGVRCEFLGGRPRDEVATAYSGARVVVVASRLESFSLVALEAAQAGRPVVLSTGAGASELQSRGAPFDVFPSGDAASLAQLLEPLLADRAEAARRGADGRSFVVSEAYRRSVADGWLSALGATTQNDRLGPKP